MPCSNCFRAQKPCHIAEGYHRCDECIRLKVRCDGHEFADSLMRSLDELKRLKEEKKALTAQMMEMNRKFLVLASQEQRLECRAEELFKRGTLIAESDPRSYSGDPVASPSGDPLVNDVLPILEFDWSALDPAVLAQADQTAAAGSSGASQGAGGS
ncbi:hypothetical protein QBC34DRAFT_406775 [Podospora aff. communis PSN243]|uniref:Zn(2)-C6 fungal-type domain-containing protein n=1 Tax=Podospora aff. communis PSN243 TaxID=3040156 RepID=A0AAV9GNB8_9PEZI|nr:hypothetical protein QBC34DRAFT_406775 [Podospora aff. communis PSN243]